MSEKAKANYEEQWQFMFQNLQAFYKEHGHTKVSRSDDKRLSLWTTRQRQSRRNLKKEYPIHRVELLNQIGFDWGSSVRGGDDTGKEKEQRRTPSPATSATMSANDNDKRWQVMFLNLKAFHAKHGHCQLPCEYSPDRKLGYWAKRQRDNYLLGRLKPNRKAALDTLGFKFPIERKKKDPRQEKSVERDSETSPASDVQSARNEKWNSMYQKLVMFDREHGHCNIPYTRASKATEENQEINALGIWVKRQKSLRHTLPKDRKEKLNRLNFSWPPDPVGSRLTKRKENPNNGINKRYTRKAKQRRTAKIDTWTAEFEDLKKFQSKFGHTVPTNAKGYRRLSSWVVSQRLDYMCGRLSKSKEERLNEIGFVWFLTDRAVREATEAKFQSQLAAPTRNNSHHSNNHSWSDDDNADPFYDRHPVGTKVKAYFDGYGWAKGSVVSKRYGSSSQWHVVYEDGDEEQFDLDTLSDLDQLVKNANSETYRPGTVVIKKIRDNCFVFGRVQCLRGEHYSVCYDSGYSQDLLFGSTELDEMVNRARLW